MSALSLTLLGTPQIALDDAPLGFTYRKVGALLIYLALEGPKVHSRAALAGLLWSDAPESVARASLSQALTNLRSVLGERAGAAAHQPPLLLVDSATIRLNPAAQVISDVHTFQALIAACDEHAHYAWRTCAVCGERLRRAAALYRGDFLAQFVLRDGALFEEWALLQREQLRQQAIGVYERLVEQAEWRGAFSAAITLVRQQISLDPWLDPAHRELIRLLALNGQRAVALAHYEQFRRTLARELGMEPDHATEQLAATIRSAAPLAGAADLRRVGPAPGSFPNAPTPMLGRNAELAALLERIRRDEVRALTISGPPGVGKTRLALAAAAAVRHDFCDGVWFITLAPIDDATLVPQALALVLGIRENPREPIATTLIKLLQTRHSLLVLDNCEHLPQIAPLLATLLAECPALHLLITSRAPLQIRAEQLMPLAPLAIPVPATGIAAIAAAPSVQLLIARTQALKPEFRLAESNSAALAAICARSDGLPLAIELIAPQLAQQTPEHTLAQLAVHLPAPAAGPRDLPARQQTIAAAIAWSVDRLDRQAQTVFARLAVFVGGASYAALQAVAGPTTLAPILELLQRQSLLQTATSGTVLRYIQLETIRNYGAALLAERGELEQARSLHLDWLCDFAEQAGGALLGSDGAEWSARIAAEFDNLRHARRWAIDTGRIAAALRIAVGIWRFHWQRGLLSEGLAWLEEGLAQQTPIEPLLEMRALRAAGVLALGMGRYTQAVARLETARDLAMRHESSDEYGAALTNLGLVLREQGRFDEACACLEQAVLVNRTMTDNPATAKFPLIILAGLYERIGAIERAAELYHESLQINQRLGDREGSANGLYGLGVVARMRGDYRLAHELAAQSLDHYQALNHQFGIAWVHCLIGDIAATSHAAPRHVRPTATA
ncbi:MAG: tetratricopeptide repeat protein [Oscillochloris sp.]|nr:tetratricopeptide repeat protein [Oscillochloris sp.]